MKLTLFDINPKMCAAWEAEFGDEATILNCSFDDLPFQNYLINAGNSFGLMDGGIDRIIMEHLEKDKHYFKIEKRIDFFKSDFEESFCGFIPIGLSKIYHLPNSKFTDLIFTPTMVWPQNIADTYNVFYAFYGALVALRNKGCWRDDKVACCGLGTGVGGVSPEDSAKQMKTALDFFYKKRYTGWKLVDNLKQTLGSI